MYIERNPVKFEFEPKTFQFVAQCLKQGGKSKKGEVAIVINM
jgi:hypothetical protein